MLEGHDLLVQAPTGTGKTCAFGIPALEMVQAKKQTTQVLIVCPTRELVLQTTKVLQDLASRADGIRVVPIYGGVPIRQQINRMRNKPHIIVATPGRLKDHLQRRTISLANISLAVLDEADRMLDMGFRKDIQFILRDTPKKKQVALFSATISSEIKKIASQYQKNPRHITIEADEPARQIDQYYNRVKNGGKNSTLCHLLDENKSKPSLVFVRTKRMTTRLTRDLKRKGYSAEAINGDLRQNQRDAVMRRYRSGKTTILVATDIVARGIDIDDIGVVINYDIPDTSETYVHRIGRTGRANKEGQAHTLVYAREQKEIESIMRETQNHIIPA